VQRSLIKFLIVTSAVLSLPLHPALGFAQGFSRLQVLLPGESAAPGTATGKFGTPASQVVGIPFDVRVSACDDSWNTVASITDVVRLTSTDATASLPAATALQAGTRTLAVTINAAGSFTISATDQTDNTIPVATSSPFSAMLVHGFEFTRINQKNQYAGVDMPISFHAVDPSGSPVPGFSSTVNLQELTSFGIGRIEPSQITMTNGTWSGNVRLYRADETAINRGNVNIYAYLSNEPAVNGTSDPFTVHPGTFSRVQIVVPGQDPWPGSVSGLSGDPATQGAAQNFVVEVYATDQYWNPLYSADTVRIASSDPAASTPVTGALTNGFRQFTLSLGTVGTQTLTVTDQTNGSIQGMTSAGIQVIPSAAHHFVIDPVTGPVTAGTSVPVQIRATDATGNTIPTYNGDAILTANTGPQSITPTAIVFASGLWNGSITFRGAGGAVSFTCSDFGAPPKTGTSNSFEVLPGPFTGLQVVPAGQTAQGGTPTGVSGVPSTQQAGATFTVQIRAVDQFWNRVPGIGDRISLTSTDLFAAMPAETTLANGELLLPVRLFRAGLQTITADDVSQGSITAHTSSPIPVEGGPYSRVVITVDGQSLAPGTPNGQYPNPGPEQSINFTFRATVHATDSWFNPVSGASDRVRITSTDPLARVVVDNVEHYLPYDYQLTDDCDGNGTPESCVDLFLRMSSGGFQKLIVSSVDQPSMPSNFTEFPVDETGVHLEAFVGANTSPDTYQAGEQFVLTVKIVNDAGSVIVDLSSNVDVSVRHASSGDAGRGVLARTGFQVTQGIELVPETYTFAEPIVLEVRDEAGNIARTEAVTILPGPPTQLLLSSAPTWVQGNKHAAVNADLLDFYGNGVPGRPVTFELVSGPGEIAPIDSLELAGTNPVDAVTDAAGRAQADFHSGRQPAVTKLRARSAGFITDYDIQTAFVDPDAPGGHITSYPNPFHPKEAPTTIAYKLDDNANVKLEVYTLAGGLVLRKEFPLGSPGGQAGLNEFVWDGKNGKGEFVASGGYLLIINAEGVGETLHKMHRKIAVVH